MNITVSGKQVIGTKGWQVKSGVVTDKMLSCTHQRFEDGMYFSPELNQRSISKDGVMTLGNGLNFTLNRFIRAIRIGGGE